MRFEMIKELEEDDAKLEIPWESPENPSLRYEDLKAHPELISSLEEVRKIPFLGDVLRTLNAPGSAFKTAKCGVWSTQELTQEERLELGPVHKLGAYLDVVFDLPGFNFSLEHYLKLGEKLERMLGVVKVTAHMEFVIRHCLYHPGKTWGFYATLFLHAYGMTPEHAHRTLRQAMEALTAAVGSISGILRSVVANIPPDAPSQ